MKIISWNINGLNNILSKSKEGMKQAAHIEANSLQTLIADKQPDIICLQEVRCSTSLDFLKSHFEASYPYIYINCAKNKKGYSGTAILSKVEPQDVYYDMEKVKTLSGELDEGLQDEGRVIRARFKDFTVINVYSPNSKPNLERLEFRCSTWEPALRNVIASHRNTPVILCGDLNVAHTENDIHSPSSNHNHAGFTQQERLAFGLLLHNLHMIDTFRHLHPHISKYSWWSNFHNSRAKNKGWRIDYFVVSKTLQNRIRDADIFTEYYGSDHAPVYLEIQLV